MRTKKTIYLHIGYGKTGSSAIQAALMSNVSLLRSWGVHVSMVARNHLGKAPALAKHENFSKHGCVSLRDLGSALIRDIIESPCEKVVISQETLVVQPAALVSFYRSLFSPFRVKFICYIRDQCKLVPSAYLTSVRMQALHGFDTFQEYFNLRWMHYDYCRALGPWCSCGLEGTIRVYDPRIIGPDVRIDFLRWLVSERADSFGELSLASGRDNVSLHPWLERAAIELAKVMPSEVWSMCEDFLGNAGEYLPVKTKSFLGSEEINLIRKRYCDSNIKFASQYLCPSDADLFLGHSRE